MHKQEDLDDDIYDGRLKDKKYWQKKHKQDQMEVYKYVESLCDSKQESQRQGFSQKSVELWAKSFGIMPRIEEEQELIKKRKRKKKKKKKVGEIKAKLSDQEVEEKWQEFYSAVWHKKEVELCKANDRIEDIAKEQQKKNLERSIDDLDLKWCEKIGKIEQEWVRVLEKPKFASIRPLYIEILKHEFKERRKVEIKNEAQRQAADVLNKLNIEFEKIRQGLKIEFEKITQNEYELWKSRESFERKIWQTQFNQKANDDFIPVKKQSIANTCETMTKDTFEEDYYEENILSEISCPFTGECFFTVKKH